MTLRRIALFSDVHGNLVALDAVLAEIDSSGIEECYCLGDLVGYGPDPTSAAAPWASQKTETRGRVGSKS